MDAVDAGKAKVEVQVSVSKVEIEAKENTIKINNNRNLWEKYTSYECDITVSWNTDSKDINFVIYDIGTVSTFNFDMNS